MRVLVLAFAVLAFFSTASGASPPPVIVVANALYVDAAGGAHAATFAYSDGVFSLTSRLARSGFSAR